MQRPCILRVRELPTSLNNTKVKVKVLGL
jgi:hypothetical protein